MKKLLALLLALTMTFGMVACGSKETTDADKTTEPGTTETGNTGDTAEGGETTGDTTAITIWTYPIGKFGDRDAVNELIAKFNEVHPEISVTLELLDYTNGDTQVTGAITAGTTPDIIMEGPERLVTNWGAAGKMVDLSDLWTDEVKADIEATSPSVVSACQLDGKYYEYPLCMTTHTMAINYEAFEAAGALQYIDEETRTWTTEDFQNALKALKDAGATPVNGIVYCGGQGGDQGTRALVNNLYSGTYTNAEHTEYTANSPENVEALTLLQTLVNDGLLVADPAAQAADELQQFANGTAAMTFCWNASNKAQYAADVSFTPFAMAFPSDDGQPELCGGIWGFGIFDNGDQARIDAAKTFIQFVCDDETQAAASVQMTGFFPVRASLGNVYAGTETEADADEFLTLMPYLGDYYNVTGGWTEQRTLWFNMLQQVFSGTDAQTAADTFVESANANIK
ncbi:MAG TPA: extracellular solute-binding protein [Candidatus Avoscillospira avistercoris]|uniref:Extracellular solute-binding protein n=1 Tax=Candidatus Avoscillospira avistercoris TaxID=2840707 RepID=A0A9D1FB15_9FIRM|nr:extracellular solute-binding protein [Candidatus Avoscillospira avistercoris]